MSVSAPQTETVSRNNYPRILLAHHELDRWVVLELAERLPREGIETDIEPDNLSQDGSQLSEVSEALQNYDLIVICLSEKSTQVEWLSQYGLISRSGSGSIRISSAQNLPEMVIGKLETCQTPSEIRHLPEFQLYDINDYQRLLEYIKGQAGDDELITEVQSQLEQEAVYPANTLESVKIAPPGSHFENAVFTPTSLVALQLTPHIVLAKPGTTSDVMILLDNNGTGEMAVGLNLVGLEPGWYNFDTTDMVLKPGRNVNYLHIRTPADVPPRRFTPTVTVANEDDVLASQTLTVEVIEGDAVQPTPEPPAPARLEDKDLEKNAANDQPVDDIKNDKLGFELYVRALYDFIVSPDTGTPLTIGVNGVWGSGKSSLMKMLQTELETPLIADDRQNRAGMSEEQAKQAVKDGKRYQHSLWRAWIGGWLLWLIPYWVGKLLAIRSAKIRAALAYDPTRPNTPPPSGFWQKAGASHAPMTPLRHPTIWFNAWRFSKDEQVWSALIVAILEQLKRKQNLWERLSFWVKLTVKRGAFGTLLVQLTLPLVWTGIALLYKQFGPKGEGSAPLGVNADSGLVWLVPVVGVIGQLWNIYKNPFQAEIKKVLSQHNYKDRVGFIGQFDEDFERIIKLATQPSMAWKPQKLVIFIDDLDRCPPLQAAAIIEAINLLLNQQQCVFVLGMDYATVAANIETKYKEMTERMKRETPGLVSPGTRFLDKIVQVPFNLPRPNPAQMKELVAAIVQSALAAPPKELSTSDPNQTQTNDIPATGDMSNKSALATPNQTRPNQNVRPVVRRNAAPVRNVTTPPPPDAASPVRKEVREAIDIGVELLKENPRQVKRFINLFRLQLYIANARGLLDLNNQDEAAKKLSPSVLAVWVAWSMQWPELVRFLLEDDPQTSNGLRGELYTVAGALEVKGGWSVSTITQEEKTITVSRYDEVNKTITVLRETQKTSTSHWAHLPWHDWLTDPDFLHSLKRLEHFWALPQDAKDDLLLNILEMTQRTR